jgi:hypothetical protein
MIPVGISKTQMHEYTPYIDPIKTKMATKQDLELHHFALVIAAEYSHL